MSRILSHPVGINKDNYIDKTKQIDYVITIKKKFRNWLFPFVQLFQDIKL